MEPRVSFITLAVDDLHATRQFYVDGLGWPTELDVPGEVIMIKVGERLILSLWAAAEFEDEVGQIQRGVGLAPITLAHNVGSRKEVDLVMEDAHGAGATIGREAAETFWGGYSGVFLDPDGHPWEVAHNPHWGLADDGSVILNR